MHLVQKNDQTLIAFVMNQTFTVLSCPLDTIIIRLILIDFAKGAIWYGTGVTIRIQKINSSRKKSIKQARIIVLSCVWIGWKMVKKKERVLQKILLHSPTPRIYVLVK